MQQDDAPEPGHRARASPATASRRGTDLLLVGLVLEPADVRAGDRVVAGRAAEHHDRAAVRAHGPVRGAADRQRAV